MASVPDWSFYRSRANPHEMMEYIVKTGGSIVPQRLNQIWEMWQKRAMIAEISHPPGGPVRKGIPSSRGRGPSGPTPLWPIHQLRAHSLRRGPAHPAAHDLHHAVECHVRLPTPFARSIPARIARWRTFFRTG